jgi:hypothetical protein
MLANHDNSGTVVGRRQTEEVRKGKGSPPVEDDVAETTLGLEVDGQHVTVVECVGDVAVSVRSVMLDDLKDTVDLVLAGYKQHRNDPPMRVALSCDQIVTRGIDVTPAMKNRQVFDDAVYEALPLDRTATLAAGLFFDPAALTGANTLTAGVAAVAPRSAIADTYRAFVGRRTELVPPSFALAGIDGLWLGLRYAVSDLTLVVNGRPVLYRQLRAGGLDTIAGLLGDGESGSERLEIALHRSGPSDPVADAELDRWLRIVAMETRQTIDFWARSGEQVPEGIIAFGAAAAAVGLDGALASANLTNSFPDELHRAMSFIPPADRPAAVLAFAAARTVGLGAPQSVFVNPVITETAQENRRRTRQLARVSVGITAAVAVVATTLVPLGSAWVDRSAAAAALRDATAKYEPLAGVYEQLSSTYQREDAIAAVALEDTQWSDVVRFALGLAPSVDVTQFAATRTTNDAGTDVVLVTVTAERTGGTYADLTSWLSKLRSTVGITRAWSSSYTNRDGLAGYQLSFEIDPSILGTPRTSVDITSAAIAEAAPAQDEIPAIQDPAINSTEETTRTDEVAR